MFFQSNCLVSGRQRRDRSCQDQRKNLFRFQSGTRVFLYSTNSTKLLSLTFDSVLTLMLLDFFSESIFFTGVLHKAEVYKAILFNHGFVL